MSFPSTHSKVRLLFFSEKTKIFNFSIRAGNAAHPDGKVKIERGKYRLQTKGSYLSFIDKIRLLVRPFLTLRFTTDKSVRRLRWVMSFVIAFDIVITLAGQRASFWYEPQSAIRADGLSVYHLTNHMFVFFLESGWMAFLSTTVLYMLVMYLMVSMVPRRLALVALLSLIFAHYYDGSNWLAVHWHMGMQGPFLYGLAIAAALAQAGFTSLGSDRAIKSLRWIAVAAMLTDALATLYGQPRGYWHNSLLVDEGNPASKYFLTHGWIAYALEQAVICSAIFILVSKLPRRWALFVAFCFLLGGFTGAANWFFYRWLWGIQGLVIFGVLLSTAAVLFAVDPAGGSERTQKEGADQIPSLIIKPGRKAGMMNGCS
jgi:hypothetical protein